MRAFATSFETRLWMYGNSLMRLVPVPEHHEDLSIVGVRRLRRDQNRGVPQPAKLDGGKPRPALFRRRHFEDHVIVLCVRWYLRYV
jgi:hypothetical protein